MTSRLKTRAALGVVVAAATLGAGLAHAVGVPGQGTWEATLQPRDINGDTVTDAFYDTVLNITWLRNANLNGAMNWSTSNTWANTLVVGGVGGWRLPKVVDTGPPGCDFSYLGTDCGFNVQPTTGEMAHLYYLTLGNKAFYDASGIGGQPGSGLTNTGGFQNLQGFVYWSGTEYAPDQSNAWGFNTPGGSQFNLSKSSSSYALAVRPGDVAAVPEPQTYALMLVGIGALTLALRRRER